MRFGVLGTGNVGQTIGSRLVSVGHDVLMGSRDGQNPKAAEWAKAQSGPASAGTFAEAAEFGELVVNATAGAGSLPALHSAGADALRGKVLIDISNPLDFSGGMPPSLFVSNTDSLAEQIQRAFPETRVVKTLNTMNAVVMVNPALVPGDHSVFVSGDDADAKRQVTEVLASFGWPDGNVIDLGGIATARGTESYLHLWLALRLALGDNQFNVRVVRG